jgi:hypothetical protein
MPRVRISVAENASRSAFGFLAQIAMAIGDAKSKATSGGGGPPAGELHQLLLPLQPQQRQPQQRQPQQRQHQPQHQLWIVGWGQACHFLSEKVFSCFIMVFCVLGKTNITSMTTTPCLIRAKQS